jgi:hypothetical protein
MRGTAELWYLRLPDGRVFRAAGTAVVRQQLISGRLPPATRLRRSPEEEWRSFERWTEFSDLAGPAANGPGSSGTPTNSAEKSATSGTIASRIDSVQLRQVGVRALMEELLAALDNTAVRGKLLVSLWAGLVVGALAGLLSLPFFSLELSPPGPGWLLIFGMLLIVLWLTGLLTQLVFSELSRLRPARWADGVKGITALTCRLVVLQGGVWAVLAAAVMLCRELSAYLLAVAGTEPAADVLAGIEVATVAVILVEGLVWLLGLLVQTIAPLLVVEGCSVSTGLWRWLRLVRRHFGRLLLAEGMALGVGLLLSGPAALLVWILQTATIDGRLLWAAGFARCLVAGMAGSLLLAYLVVANVFIYLHLRYEHQR